MTSMLIFMVFRFSKTDIIGMAREKKRGRHVHVLMDGHVLFLKHLDKLFAAKLFVSYAFF